MYRSASPSRVSPPHLLVDEPRDLAHDQAARPRGLPRSCHLSRRCHVDAERHRRQPAAAHLAQLASIGLGQRAHNRLGRWPHVARQLARSRSAVRTCSARLRPVGMSLIIGCVAFVLKLLRLELLRLRPMLSPEPPSAACSRWRSLAGCAAGELCACQRASPARRGARAAKRRPRRRASRRRSPRATRCASAPCPPSPGTAAERSSPSAIGGCVAISRSRATDRPHHRPERQRPRPGRCASDAVGGAGRRGADLATASLSVNGADAGAQIDKRTPREWSIHTSQTLAAGTHTGEGPGARRQRRRGRLHLAIRRAAMTPPSP